MKHPVEIIGTIFGISLLRYFIIAGIPFLIFYKIFFLYFDKAKIQKKKANSKDFVREILHSIQTTAVFAIIGFIVLYTPAKQHTLIYTHLADYTGWWVVISLALSMIIHDTYFYWMHRLLHHRKLFRYTHLLHHRSISPSPWTSYSFGFIEAIMEGAVLIPIVLMIPLHLVTIVLFVLIGFAINVYGHLGYEIAPRWLRHSLLFEVITTSVHHNMHHSNFNGNYGLYFRIWDRLLGTENPDYIAKYDRIQQKRFGVENKR